MARARARTAAIPAKAAKPAAKGRMGMVAVWISIIVIAVVLLATVPVVAMFIGAGLAPTLTAALIDRDPEKHAAVSVGALNVAGLSPYVIRMFAHPGAAQQMLSDMFVWFVVYAAAAVGWDSISASRSSPCGWPICARNGAHATSSAVRKS